MSSQRKKSINPIKDKKSSDSLIPTETSPKATRSKGKELVSGLETSQLTITKAFNMSTKDDILETSKTPATNDDMKKFSAT